VFVSHHSSDIIQILQLIDLHIGPQGVCFIDLSDLVIVVGVDDSLARILQEDPGRLIGYWLPVCTSLSFST
jgi:hypothetical protein